MTDKERDKSTVCSTCPKKKDCGEFLECWGNWESPDWGMVNSKGLNYSAWQDCNWENQQIDEQEKAKKEGKQNPPK